METNEKKNGRTQRLEHLRAEVKKLDARQIFGPNKVANHEKLAEQWHVLQEEIGVLESSFILYQGQEIDATLVNYLSGNIPTSTVDHDGDEELFRDERGCYYLRRTLNLLDSEHDDPQPASGRTHVHRINVNAAILWATTRLNSNTLDLRNDAANLLMEGRSYADPHPSHLSAEQRAMVSDPDRFAKASQGTGPGPQVMSGRIVIELDDLASAMLRRACREGNECREAGEDPRDLVNAAVTFYLCGDKDHRHGQFDLDCGDDVLARAKSDRLVREGKEAA